MHRQSSAADWPQTAAEHTVVVLGASPKPARYSNQAIRSLVGYGYRVIPVHPTIATIENLAVQPDLRGIRGPVHTLTLYVGAQRSRALIGDIIALNPRRVIFNPGSESVELEQALNDHHIECIHGCTLVMLRTAQFQDAGRASTMKS